MNDILYHVFMHLSIDELRTINQVSHDTQQVLNKHFWLNKLIHDNINIITPSLLKPNTYIDWYNVYNTILLIHDNIDVNYNFLVVISIESDTQEQLRQLLRTYHVHISFGIRYIDYFKNTIRLWPKYHPDRKMEFLSINPDYQQIVNFLYEAHMNGFIRDYTKI